MSKVVVVTSGKGGVGKTTTSANIATGIALQGHKTVAIDFDVGLRNLDLVMGCERRVVYDFVNVIRGEAKLQPGADPRQAHREPVRAAGVADARQGRAGPRGRRPRHRRAQGAWASTTSSATRPPASRRARRWPCTSPTRPSSSPTPRSRRCATPTACSACSPPRPAAPSWAAPDQARHLLLTRYSPAMVKRGEMLSVDDVLELLGIPLLGVIPESQGGAAVVEQGHARDPRRDHRRRAGLPGRRLPLPRARSASTASSRRRSAASSAACSANRDAEVNHDSFSTTSGGLRNRRRSPRIGCRSSWRASARRPARAPPTTCRSCSRSCWPSSRVTRRSTSSSVTVNLDRSGGCEVLELNIVLPEALRCRRRTASHYDRLAEPDFLVDYSRVEARPWLTVVDRRRPCSLVSVNPPTQA